MVFENVKLSMLISRYYLFLNNFLKKLDNKTLIDNLLTIFYKICYLELLLSYISHYYKVEILFYYYLFIYIWAWLTSKMIYIKNSKLLPFLIA